MSNYHKLIGSIVGSLVGILFSFVLARFPGVISCSTPEDINTCLAFGAISPETLNTTVLMILTAIGVYAAPANKPPS